MPAYFVIRSKRFGVLLGAAALWLLVFLCEEVSYAWAGSPPQEYRSSAVEEWLMGGWISGLVYCSLLWLLKEGFLMCWRGLGLMRHPFNSATVRNALTRPGPAVTGLPFGIVGPTHRRY